METPSVPVNFVPAKTGESFHLGKVRIRIMEDGSRTGMSAIAELFACYNEDHYLL